MAWHEEADGGVEDGLRVGRGQVAQLVAEFMLVTQVVEHVDDAALVDLRNEAANNDIDGEEDDEQGRSGEWAVGREGDVEWSRGQHMQEREDRIQETDLLVGDQTQGDGHGHA